MVRRLPLTAAANKAAAAGAAAAGSKHTKKKKAAAAAGGGRGGGGGGRGGGGHDLMLPDLGLGGDLMLGDVEGGGLDDDAAAGGCWWVLLSGLSAGIASTEAQLTSLHVEHLLPTVGFCATSHQLRLTICTLCLPLLTCVTAAAAASHRFPLQSAHARPCHCC